MGKLMYPEEETVSSIILNSVNDSISSLNNAQSNCNYTIPGDFVYVNYLVDLGNTVSNFNQRLVDLYGKVENTDKSFYATFDNMDAYLNSVDTTVLKERDRLIK
jgi:hypothetical protein